MVASRYHCGVVFDASGSPPAPGATGGDARRPLLGELLIQAKVVTPDQLAMALSLQSEPVNDKKIGQLLIERGWITEAQLTQTLSLQLSVPWVSLYHIDFSRQLLNRVERALAEKYCLIPIFVRHVKGQGETLYVAMDDPTNELALAEVARQASLPARPMIASATDIRSAIRVYYGEPNAEQVIDVPPPPVTRAEPPMTTREGQHRREPPPTPPVPTVQDPPRTSSPSAPPPGRVPSHPPPAPPARKPPPPTPHAAAQSAKAASAEESEGPPTTRSNPPPGMRPALALAATGENPAAASPEGGAGHRAEGSEPRRGRAKMLSLTLLDGTTISLPAKKNAGGADGLTARDFVSALRATAHGADATEILGEKPQWEPVVAALLSILLRKGLIADWEFIEELRKI